MKISQSSFRRSKTHILLLDLTKLVILVSTDTKSKLI